MTSSRSAAKACGDLKYFTGRKCINGHIAERYTSSGACMGCCDAYRSRPSVAAAVRQRAKEWAKNNPERTLKRIKDWRSNNPDAMNGYRKKWKDRNLELVREDARQRSAKNRKLYPEKKRAFEAKRRAQKRNASPPWINNTEITAFYKGAPSGHHVDHIVPLTHDLVCGLHVIANLQYLPSVENSIKRNSFVPG